MSIPRWRTNIALGAALVLSATAGLTLGGNTSASAEQADVTITATPIESNRVRVDWTTTRTDITGWNVGRDGYDDRGTPAWSTDKAAGDRSHTFNSLVVGTTYTFTLIPKTASGDLPAVTATATAGGGDGTPPPSSGEVTITATPIESNRVRVDWTTTRTDITGWNVGRDGYDDRGTPAWSTDKAAGDRSHTFNSLVVGTTYTFTLIPKTASGDLPAVTATATAGGGDGTPPPSSGDTAQATQNWGAPVWSDDFNGTAPSSAWGLYDDPGNQHGVRKPENCQVSNGTLKLVSETNRDTCGMSHERDQTHGRWEARVKSTGTGWKSLFIIWPYINEGWPRYGEYDWREHTAGSSCYTGFLHYPSVDNRQEGLPDKCPSGGTSQWHNVAFEWSSTRMAGWVDGVLWYQFNCASYGNLCDMPAGHLTIQNDDHGDAAGHSAVTEVDWVRGWDL
ncbi:glycoside hydrolase family 16 protein [Mangrovihabitans endophyticus]|uniref:Glycosyl hydrolases family 16 n=1 Tax=Mangrovihabitans endophyticus TaxID=1751298 RepID=A0A8J3BSA5_9ACTN|nr:glycoside hydrolase family 16 protein [Mangrovihabitans endophyticus]GGK73598.1 hypothetical protein GCM10012284_04360 [Mangrovihabitans endophyticus]